MDYKKTMSQLQPNTDPSQAPHNTDPSQAHALLLQKASTLLLLGWTVEWAEDYAYFEAKNRMATNGYRIFSVVNDQLVEEE